MQVTWTTTKLRKNNESLLAYAHFNKAKWNDISEMIKIHYDLIAKLTALKGEL